MDRCKNTKETSEWDEYIEAIDRIKNEKIHGRIHDLEKDIDNLKSEIKIMKNKESKERLYVIICNGSPCFWSDDKKQANDFVKVMNDFVIQRKHSEVYEENYYTFVPVVKLKDEK
jgi:hypothetical protein